MTARITGSAILISNASVRMGMMERIARINSVSTTVITTGRVCDRTFTPPYASAKAGFMANLASLRNAKTTVTDTEGA